MIMAEKDALIFAPAALVGTLATASVKWTEAGSVGGPDARRCRGDGPRGKEVAFGRTRIVVWIRDVVENVLTR